MATRAYDERADAIARALAAIDPAATHAAKEGAHRAFKSAVAAAQTRLQVEAAAAAWLSQINALNTGTRLANARARHERQAAEELLSDLRRLSDTAEASKAMADSAMKVCLESRAQFPAVTAQMDDPGAVAATSAPSSPPPRGNGSPTPEVDWPMEAAAVAAAPHVIDDGRPSQDWLVVDLRSPQPQAIVRLMNRDGRAMTTLVDRLAGSDPATRGTWQILLSNFVDLVLAAAIEDACLEFPAGHPFWDQFTVAQSRDIVRGLSALGFRFDGFSGFGDGRVPAQRDLALAVGSAGLLPARVRHWPKSGEVDQIFSGVRTSGDAFIARAAPAMTLGQMVGILGHRADQLADLWNDWPRVRLLLFSTSR